MDRKLKQLREQWEQLEELFRVHSFTYEDHTKSESEFSFEIGATDFFVYIDREGKDPVDYEVGFGVLDEHGSVDVRKLLNKVDATAVLGTVAAAIKDRLSYDGYPERVLLKNEPSKDRLGQDTDQTKRAKLYERVVKRMVSDLDYELVSVLYRGTWQLIELARRASDGS